MGAIENLHNRIDLTNIPFTERGSRLIMFLRNGNTVYLRLAERWVKWEQETGHYRERAPLIDRFTFHDPDGLQYDTLTTDTYPHCVTIHSPAGDFDWAFVDAETLLVRLPAGRYGLQFIVWAEEGRSDRRGGTLRGKRHVAYTTNARLLHNELAVLENVELGEYAGHGGELLAHQVRLVLEARPGDVLLLNVTPRLGFQRSLPDPERTLAEARARWEEWFARTPPVLPAYQQQYDYAWWIMRAGLLSTRFYFTREALVPSKIHYVGVWHWDQFFHALAYRHVDQHLAEDQLRILLDHQRPDGMIPDAIHDEGTITRLGHPIEGEVTKPPLIAWTVLQLYEHSGHHDFLEEVYEPLCRLQAWWFAANSDENGLGFYRHPFSSGLDDSPLWDYGMPVVSPELNTYLVIQQDSLARIAELIGDAEGAARYRQGAADLMERMLAVLWDEQAGLFRALHNGEAVPAVTPFNLLPLLTGRLPAPVAERLVRHLTDPASFWTEWPLPTVAINDPHFDPLQMWRGPVWINVNYLFVEALKRVGRDDLAAQLRRKTLDLVMQHRDIYEYYHPITARRPPKAAPIFGWSAALFIDLALQESAGQLPAEPAG